MLMEVILLQDIPNIGRKNELLLVGDGYALNFLLPQQKALVATPTVRRRYAEQIKRRAQERESEKKLKEGIGGVLEGKKITFERKVTKTGKLYAAITEKHIAEAIKDQLKATVEVEAVVLPEHIKATGSFLASVKAGSIEVPFTVVVKEMKE
ncbi:50S ribosomal protein L9 [Candidatus Peregrinibacteria bacterium CG10_big_fil_rev_8_21_14_0_10_55_24]|nr:MAG: 50S ribosomal protein L9 [Candidatus Peregrinibacteria bacterium CG10_big_fil_rev_8_21_14_0_10_55_24]